MNKMKKVILGVSLSAVIVAGGITGGVMYHQGQVKADEQIKSEQLKKDRLVAENKREDNQQKLATSAVQKLFANDTKTLLADDFTDTKLQEARNAVTKVKSHNVGRGLTDDIKTATILDKQVDDAKTKVKSLFKDEKKTALSPSVKKETVEAVKKQVKEKTPQKSSQLALTNDLNRADTLLNQQIVAQEVNKKEAEKATSKEVVSASSNQDNSNTASEASGNSKTNNNSKSGNTTSNSSGSAGNDASSSSSSSDNNTTTSNSKPNGNSSSPSNSGSTSSNNSAPAPASNQPTVAKMNLASKTSQIITVVANGSSATVNFWEKSNGTWNQVFSTSGMVGSQGVGQADEYHSRTPRGAYSLGFAFGTSNPGTSLSFRQITNKSYWISNVKDSQYNTWQERNSSNSADEKMSAYPTQYKYGVVINFNSARTPGAGSGFFLHCANGAPTAGCVSIPTSQMKTVLQKLNGGAYIVNVTSESELLNY
ncbi:L,D-transpeptidase family protein [Listeria booriae]|uniref:toxin Cry1Ac domain D-VI-related protein n=1 Tax=Listeria booriae TaxID=1552123 RepID=UPI0016238C72|nr:toxin Cry1Ac domain D-VI-related protein [Listeria booriae]MBC1920462.1 L,D-transpeptidase family protein [Listeria booriae]